MAWGVNDYTKFHPKSKKFGFTVKALHSEVAALIDYKGEKSALKNYILINIRINKFFEISISKPCKCCQDVIDQIGFKKVFFSNKQGEICQL